MVIPATDVAVEVEMVPKRDKTMAAMFGTAASCTSLHRPASDSFSDALLDINEAVVALTSVQLV